MATQTRRTTRRSARFFRATVKVYMVTACCGLVLLSAVSAYAETPRNGLDLNGVFINGMPFNGAVLNGMPMQGLPINGVPYNGMPFQGLPRNGIPMNGVPLHGHPAHEGSIPPVQSESLPWSTLSQRPLGTTPPSPIVFLALARVTTSTG
jgi:hypothetical protein